jgi:hypothetical protein
MRARNRPLGAEDLTMGHRNVENTEEPFWAIGLNAFKKVPFRPANASALGFELLTHRGGHHLERDICIVPKPARLFPTNI